MNWHRTAFLFLTLSVGVLIVLVVLLSLSIHSTGIKGFTPIYQGRCDTTSKVNSGLQFIVAILSVLISVASDFFLRLAISPTTQDVSKAHSLGIWLDIGTHSPRNMRFVSGWRTLTWLILILSSAPLQLFSHASVFATSVYTYYAQVLVSEAFFDDAPAWYPGVANPLLEAWAFDLNQANQSNFDFRNAREHWDRLEPSECWNDYVKNPAGLQYHRHLAIVIETTSTGSSSTDMDFSGWKGSDIWSNSSAEAAEDWGYPDFDPDLVNSLWSVNEYCQSDIFYTGLLNPCADDYGAHGAFMQVDAGYDGHDSDPPTVTPEPWNFSWFSPDSHPVNTVWYDPQAFGTLNPVFNDITVKYCYAEPFVTQCKAYVANPILLGVLLVVFLKCVVSAFVFYKSWGLDSIQTLGDAIQFFMQQEVPVGKRALSRLDDGHLETPMSPIHPAVRPSTPRRWAPTRKYWYMTVRRSIWLWTITPCAIFLAAVVATIISLHRIFHLNWHDYAFGEDMNNHYLNFYTGDYDPNLSDSIAPLILISLLSNMSQLIITPIYFLLNSINKIMFQSGSWAGFSLRAKRLRVSFPRARDQIGDFAFGYPLFWGLLFACFRTALGWMFTQSLFMLPRGRLEYWTGNTEIDITQVGVVIGYSVQALVVSIGFCVIVFFILPLVISFRRLPDNAVIVGTNSLVIAAQCLRVSPDSATPREAAQQPDHDKIGRFVHTSASSTGSSDFTTTNPTKSATNNPTTEKEKDTGIFSFVREIRRPSFKTPPDNISPQSPRYVQPLEWGVLDTGDELVGRPGYLGLGTHHEILGKPIPGRGYTFASSDGLDNNGSVERGEGLLSRIRRGLRKGRWRDDSLGTGALRR